VAATASASLDDCCDDVDAALVMGSDLDRSSCAGVRGVRLFVDGAGEPSPDCEAFVCSRDAETDAEAEVVSSAVVSTETARLAPRDIDWALLSSCGVTWPTLDAMLG
jgi:hypothetical protein